MRETPAAKDNVTLKKRFPLRKILPVTLLLLWNLDSILTLKYIIRIERRSVRQAVQYRSRLDTPLNLHISNLSFMKPVSNGP
ncbi:hypothetical protein CW702_00880 [Candidatus Bathyarchaeota archaeon]|nr:MAG: hypothetical protein CW702_00880 [Candidatus Bathyarchaeota archaeon]